jgi:hypothetical protein
MYDVCMCTYIRDIYIYLEMPSTDSWFSLNLIRLDGR